LASNLARLLVHQRINRNAFCVASQALRSLNPSATIAARCQSTQPAVRETTTGWDKARFPQQEMLEIHRRAAKHSEDPRLERRRQIALLKVLITVGAGIGAFLILAVFMIFIGAFDFDAPWDTVYIWTPWT